MPPHAAPQRAGKRRPDGVRGGPGGGFDRASLAQPRRKKPCFVFRVSCFVKSMVGGLVRSRKNICRPVNGKGRKSSDSCLVSRKNPTGRVADANGARTLDGGGGEAGAGGSYLVPPALSGLPCSRQALRLATLRDMQASPAPARVRINQARNTVPVSAAFDEGGVSHQSFLRPCAAHTKGKHPDRCQRRLISRMFHISRRGIFSFVFSLARQVNFPQCDGTPGRNECL